MKNLFKTAFIFITLFGLFSCQKDENVLSNIKGKAINFETFFEKVSEGNIKTSSDKVLLINYEWNAKEKTIKLLSTEEAEPSWGLAFDVAEQGKSIKRKTSNRDGRVTYAVSCKGGNSGGWTQNCSGKWSCGKLVYSCLEEEGCATVCKVPMAYVGETKTFYISNDIEDLISTNSTKRK